jgi:hypothetical protein
MNKLWIPCKHPRQSPSHDVTLSIYPHEDDTRFRTQSVLLGRMYVRLRPRLIGGAVHSERVDVESAQTRARVLQNGLSGRAFIVLLIIG